MKYALLILALVSTVAFGQHSEEWLNQKKTQEKYLKQQIAMLKVYIHHAKKGTEIVRAGLSTVNSIKKGDFNLQNDFISSFKQVNPTIKGYVKVAAIIAYQLRIITVSKEMLQGVREAGQFTGNEVAHCSNVCEKLLQRSLENIEELVTIITSSELSMKDDERIKRIDLLYADMQDKYAFVSSFSEEMGLLTVQRMRELREVDISRKLNKF